jgi:hypothetical protein
MQKQWQQQIPFGNDNQKCNCKDKCKSKSNSRFPSGMTTRKAKAMQMMTTKGLVPADGVFVEIDVDLLGFQVLLDAPGA